MKIYKYINLTEVNKALEKFAKKGIKVLDIKVIKDSIVVTSEYFYVITNENELGSERFSKVI